MIGWHHWLDGHEFEKAAGVGDGQGGLACCSAWGHRVGHDWVTELNWDGDALDHGQEESGHQRGGGRRQGWGSVCREGSKQPRPPCPGSVDKKGKEEGFVAEQWHSQLVSAPYPVLQNPRDEWMSCPEKVNLPSVSPVRMKGRNSWEDFSTKNAEVKSLQRQDDSICQITDAVPMGATIPTYRISPADVLATVWNAICTRSFTCNCKVWKPHDWLSNRGLVK